MPVPQATKVEVYIPDLTYLTGLRFLLFSIILDVTSPATVKPVGYIEFSLTLIALGVCFKFLGPAIDNKVLDSIFVILIGSISIVIAVIDANFYRFAGNDFEDGFVKLVDAHEGFRLLLVADILFHSALGIICLITALIYVNNPWVPKRTGQTDEIDAELRRLREIREKNKI